MLTLNGLEEGRVFPPNKEGKAWPVTSVGRLLYAPCQSNPRPWLISASRIEEPRTYLFIDDSHVFSTLFLRWMCATFYHCFMWDGACSPIWAHKKITLFVFVSVIDIDFSMNGKYYVFTNLRFLSCDVFPTRFVISTYISSYSAVCKLLKNL